jgi:hypothetical protein
MKNKNNQYDILADTLRQISGYEKIYKILESGI